MVFVGLVEGDLGGLLFRPLTDQRVYVTLASRLLF